MYCPTCQMAVRDSYDYCPTCGGTMRDVAETDDIEVVEVTAEVMPETPTTSTSQPATNDDIIRTLAVRRPSGELTPTLSRAREVALAAWRQPAVRAAVRTGASAVALSLAMRIARQALASPRARRTVTRTALPALSDFFRPEAERPTGEYEVVETIFYMRRIVRR